MRIVKWQAVQDFQHNLCRALSFVWKAGPGWTIASLVLKVVLGLLPLLGLYLLKLIIDSVTILLDSGNTPEAFEEVIVYIALSGLVFYFQAMLTTVASVLDDAHERVVTDYMHSMIHEKAIAVDLGYYENPLYNDKLHRVQQEAPFLPAQILKSLLQSIQDTISLVAIAGWLFLFHWAIIPVLIVGMIPKALVRLHFAEKIHEWLVRSTPFDRQSKYFHELLTTDSMGKEVRLFSLGRIFAARFQKLRKQLRKEELALDRQWLSLEIGVDFFSTLAVFGLYCFVAYRTALGHLTIGDLAVYFQAIQRSNGFLRTLLGSVTTLYKRSLFIENVSEFLNIQSSVIDPGLPRPVPQTFHDGLVLNDVSFCYPLARKNILENISLTIKPGEHIAIVGENGVGKTSLVKLLCRLYDPTQGRIELDGIDIKEFRLDDLRREIGIVFQDHVKYHLTARENIWIGDPLTPLESIRIEEAVANAGAQGIINKLGRGYDTMLGRRFDGGEELSGGEWQKIALARAFFRDSQILILDEPTSAMDAKAEYELFQGFHSLTKGRMAILISHRLSTVKMVDRIYVLENGRIVESGTHDELVNQSGRYATLFEMQAKKYR